MIGLTSLLAGTGAYFSGTMSRVTRSPLQEISGGRAPAWHSRVLPRQPAWSGFCRQVIGQIVLDQRRQSIMAFAEIDKLGRHHDPNPARRKDHAGPAQAPATAAIRTADAPSSRKMVITPTTISGRLGPLDGRLRNGRSTITAANSTASSGAGRISLPCRTIVRHVDRWFGFRPCRFATSVTIAPGRRLSETNTCCKHTRGSVEGEPRCHIP
jgi:hypothetical protein